jgi:hypothetical protein
MPAYLLQPTSPELHSQLSIDLFRNGLARVKQPTGGLLCDSCVEAQHDISGLVLEDPE